MGVVHASPDAPSVTATSTAAPILFENAAFPAGTDYAEVGDGTLTALVLAAPAPGGMATPATATP